MGPGDCPPGLAQPGLYPPGEAKPSEGFGENAAAPGVIPELGVKPPNPGVAPPDHGVCAGDIPLGDATDPKNIPVAVEIKKCLKISNSVQMFTNEFILSHSK